MRWNRDKRMALAVCPHRCRSCKETVWLERMFRFRDGYDFAWRCKPCDTVYMIERNADRNQN